MNPESIKTWAFGINCCGKLEISMDEYVNGSEDVPTINKQKEESKSCMKQDAEDRSKMQKTEARCRRQKQDAEDRSKIKSQLSQNIDPC